MLKRASLCGRQGASCVAPRSLWGVVGTASRVNGLAVARPFGGGTRRSGLADLTDQLKTNMRGSCEVAVVA